MLWIKTVLSMNSDHLKKALLLKCHEYVDQRLQRIKDIIATIQESLSSETKSSAGDKHETGRAMLQLEREKAGKQLAEVQKLKEILAKIEISTSSGVIRLGSIVYTSRGIYFLSISVGKIDFSDTSYFAIATDTPIGKLLLGKKVGDRFSFQNKEYSIDKLL